MQMKIIHTEGHEHKVWIVRQALDSQGFDFLHGVIATDAHIEDFIV